MTAKQKIGKEAASENLLFRVLRFLGAQLLIGLLAAVVSLLFFGWLAEEVLKGETDKFDGAARSFVHGFASPPLTAFMQAATFLGSTGFLIGFGVLVAAAFYFAGWRRALILFAVTVAGAVVLNFTLKTAFHRARPDPFFDVPLPSSYSFPSGHALFAVCFYGVLTWLFAARIEKISFKIGVWLLAGMLISAIGISRVYLGVHFPGDVLAGYAAAFVWTYTIALGDFWIRRRRAIEKNLSSEPN